MSILEERSWAEPDVSRSKSGNTAASTEQMSFQRMTPSGHEISHDEQYSSSESTDLPSHHCASPESITEWPVFDNKYDRRSIESSVFSTAALGDFMVHGDVERSQSKSNSTKGVREDDILDLTNRFMRNVHTKNPILDAKELYSLARLVSEDGFDWNKESCLILIVCALGSISVAFGPTEIAFRSPHDVRKSRHFTNASEYGVSLAYYTACKKRVGFLDSSIMAIQCFFLIGVYEMYMLRPLQAWDSFHRACVAFRMHIAAESKMSATFDRPLRTLQNRLYWSCLKSEWYVLRNRQRSPADNLVNFVLS